MTAKKQNTSKLRYKTSFNEIRRTLDIFWLKDESLEDAENLPTPILKRLNIKRKGKLLFALV